LCLDLAEATGSIYTTGRVIWSNETGRTGFRFAGLAPDSLFHLREWLFLNAMAGVANAEAELAAAQPIVETAAQNSASPKESIAIPTPYPPISPIQASMIQAQLIPSQPLPAQLVPTQLVPTQNDALLRPNYTDTLAAVTAVQRQVESLGGDLVSALQLIAARTETLLRATGAAIALATENPNVMLCRASSGPDAPPVGAPLQVGSGFSGACVREARTLRCDDTETDPRVDRESCRVLGIRSILATPVRMGEKIAGIVEAFSPYPNNFNDNDNSAMQRLAETVLAAVNRAARGESVPMKPEPAHFEAPQGGVLFAAIDEKEKVKNKNKDQAEISAEPQDKPGNVSIRLPRSYLILLFMAAATIMFTLGYVFAPVIVARFKSPEQGTVLASTPASKSVSSAAPPSVATASLEQLQQMAEAGDALAQNSLGLRYATGEGVKLDESEAIHWFTKSAEQGNVSAQSKLGSLYWRGRGVPQNLSQAYFWMVLARAGGDDASKALAPILRNKMTAEQSRAIEQQAENWLQQRQPGAKPHAGH
jgi:TPR repeat protein